MKSKACSPIRYSQLPNVNNYILLHPMEFNNLHIKVIHQWGDATIVNMFCTPAVQKEKLIVYNSLFGVCSFKRNTWKFLEKNKLCVPGVE